MALIKLESPKCAVCEKTTVLDLDSDDVQRYANGALIQDVWPDMSPEAREVIQTGTHPECWKEIFDLVETDMDIFDQIFNQGYDDIQRDD